MADYTLGALANPTKKDDFTPIFADIDGKDKFLVELHKRDRECAFTGRPICRRCALDDFKAKQASYQVKIKGVLSGMKGTKAELDRIMDIDWQKYYDCMELNPDDPISIKQERIGPMGSKDFETVTYAKFRCKNVDDYRIHKKDLKLDTKFLDPKSNAFIHELIDDIIKDKREKVVTAANREVKKKSTK